jgi:hypothetical protein
VNERVTPRPGSAPVWSSGTRLQAAKRIKLMQRENSVISTPRLQCTRDFNAHVLTSRKHVPDRVLETGLRLPLVPQFDFSGNAVDSPIGPLYVRV